VSIGSANVVDGSETVVVSGASVAEGAASAGDVEPTVGSGSTGRDAGPATGVGSVPHAASATKAIMPTLERIPPFMATTVGPLIRSFNGGCAELARRR
jgi:hypothetical protein